MNKIIFYRCNHCGNLAMIIEDGKVNPVCCGEKMEKLVAESVEASKEKHIPVVNVSGNIVTIDVGTVAHPMIEEHKIDWIYLVTKNGGSLKKLEAGEAPKATFAIVEDEFIGAYAYCNIHGLWIYEVK